jgi:hypothetical protein
MFAETAVLNFIAEASLSPGHASGRPAFGRCLAGFAACVATLAAMSAAQTIAAEDGASRKHVVLPIEINSPLPDGPTPMDVEIDFAAKVRDASLPGVFDPNSVEVLNAATGERVPHAISPHIAYGDKARLRWLVTDPKSTKFEVRFSTASERPVLQPRDDTPMIGIGDLLRYTGKTPRPIGSSLPTRLIDVNGDGILDLVATDYYTTEPLWPERIPESWSPFLCYPGVDANKPNLFGNAVRLRYRDTPDGKDQFFVGGYMHADVADINGDGLPDLAFASMEKSSEASRVKDVFKYIHIYLNSGNKDEGGMPIFVYTDRVEHPTGKWGPVRIVDLDGDGAVDFTVGSLFSEIDPRAYFIRNTNPKGWPFQAAEAVEIQPGAMATYLDVDGDGTKDSVCVTHDERFGPRTFCSRVAWHKGLGGSPPKYGPEQRFPEIEDKLCEFVSALDTPGRKGILVAEGYIGERVLFYELKPTADGQPAFERQTVKSLNAPIRGGDQPTPCICDWNNDGKWDIVYGGGFGWVRVFVNEGTNESPSFAEGKHALTEGKPINLHMNEFFPGLEGKADGTGGYFHDLGYVHPTFVDWDGDQLPDLVMSNVGNRIYWYKNVGTREEPTFGPRQQVICDGYEETPETLAETGRRLGAGSGNWQKTPPDADLSPFWWRARVGFGDLNGDGLMDLVTSDADTLNAQTNNYADGVSLFVQYRDDKGNLRLRRDHNFKLPDGSNSINVLYQPSQTIVHDWDGDGLLDLVINDGATMDSAPAVLRNIGTKTEPKFDFPKRLACYGEVLNGIAKHGPYYGVGDMDGDGKSDLIASTEVGTYVFFRRAALDMERHPDVTVGDVRVETN